MNASTNGARSLSLAIASSEYLEKHHIAEIVSGLLRELVEKHPEEPLQYLSNRLLEVKDGGCPPPDSAVCEEGTAAATPAELPKGATAGEAAAEASRQKRRVEDALLAIAVGAKGAIGPAVVEEAAATVRRETCKKALTQFLTKAAVKDKEYLPHFRKKLLDKSKSYQDTATRARKSADDAQQRFAEMVPELAERIALELKRTEAAYWAALEGVMEREPQAMADLEEFTEQRNVGPFKGKGVEVQVVVAGRFDHVGNFIQSSSLDRVALRAVVEEIDADPNGKVSVKLHWEQPDSEFDYAEGFTCSTRVERRCIYGGEPELAQKLSEGLEPSSVQAFLEVYDLAERSLPGLNHAVEEAVQHATLSLREADAGADPHIKVKTAPLKAFERAAAKAAEKYKLRFNKLLDIARLTIVCSALAELVAVLQAIEISTALRIVRMKNRLNPLFPADESAGYRDVLLNVVLLETGCVCEVQVSLAAFVAVKAGGGHAAYKIGRAIGTDWPVETTYSGGLSMKALRRVSAGLTQRLRLEGTTIDSKSITELTKPGFGLASQQLRLIELRMGACGGIAKKEIRSLLTEDVCAGIGSTVRYIDLTATGLVGCLGDAPIAEHCVKLETLKLNDNRLVGPIPASFSKLSRLRALSICDNPTLQGEIPPELGEARQLETLELHFCGLTGPIPAELGSLQRLQGLYLNDNRLSGQVPKELGNLRLLRELTLHRNQLSGLIPKELAQLNKVTDLRLYENKFENADDFKELFSFTLTQSRNNAAGLKRLNLAGGTEDEDDRHSVSHILASARSHRSGAVSGRSGVSETQELSSDEEEQEKTDSEEAAGEEAEDEEDEDEEEDEEEEEEETKD